MSYILSAGNGETVYDTDNNHVFFMLITIHVQLVLLGEGTDFIFLYLGQNNFHHRLLLNCLYATHIDRKI